MSNPLAKRIPRELKKDFGKFLVIFAFLVLLISLLSGFLVATESSSRAYYEGVEKYKLEHGHLAFSEKPPAALLDAISEQAEATFYKLFYVNLRNSRGQSIRLYENRTEVDLPCLMAGKLPEKADEIAVDRLFAENNQLAIGAKFPLGGRDLTICGTVALPDYSVLFENNADSMFSAKMFTPALVTAETFRSFSAYPLNYNYAWRYNDAMDRYNDKASNDASEKLSDALQDCLRDYNNSLVDEAVGAGKLLLLDKVLTAMEKDLEAAGLRWEMFDNEAGRAELLNKINACLQTEKTDLSQELADGKRDVRLSTADVKKALQRTDQQIKEAEHVLDELPHRLIVPEDYLPQYLNQAINFGIDDIGGDTAMFMTFDYLVTLVIAFVFAVTISSTIHDEAGVIGTLRASGYTGGELLRHYMALPILVSLGAGLVGNLIGYTWLRQIMADLYYHSYSLVKYETVWNPHAFLLTTLIPLLLMLLINFIVLKRKLSLPVMAFLRRDLSKKRRKIRLQLSPRIPFLHRFRLRVIAENLPNYLTLFLGIFLGGLVMAFSLMFRPLIDDYKNILLASRIADYQYMLKADADEVKAEGAEKFCFYTLKSSRQGYTEDDISVYGIAPASRYVKADLKPSDVLISSAYAAKFQLQKGDRLELKDSYQAKRYTLHVSGVYPYEGGLAVFLPRQDFNQLFGKKSDYFTGYLSGQKLTEIAEEDIVKLITPEDLSKMSAQLIDSMGNFMDLMKNFGVIMFLLLMYLLSKQMIERNSKAISMVKILGFKDAEIGRVYITATTIVVILSLAAVCPLIHESLHRMFIYFIYRKMKGYIPFIVRPEAYVQMAAAGLLCYAVIAFWQLLKIRRIDKAEILKYTE